MSNLSSTLEHQKAAIYIRVSTHWQVDKDSLQVQKRELENYCRYALGISDCCVFEDAGFSAKNTDRPDYQEMMYRIRSGEFSHLLVWKIDRISRNLLDFSSMYYELKSLGVTFVSKNEQFDTSTAIGEAMLKIILVFAELERNMTAERVTAVMLSRANNGQWNGGWVPYGYRYDKESNSFSVVENEASVVRKIYDLYISFQSVGYVCNQLNEKGYRSHKGGNWSIPSVHHILTNVWYIGEYRYNVRNVAKDSRYKDENEWITYKDHHEPIIEQSKFDKVQFILNKKKRGGNVKGSTVVKKNIHMFAGLVECGECGSNMAATLDRMRSNGWRPSMYGCSKRRNRSGSCSGKYISDVTLGPFVFNIVSNIMRAKGQVKPKTTLPILQGKILRGALFSDVSIDEQGLRDLKEMLVSDHDLTEYKGISDSQDTDIESALSVLQDKKRKTETAIARLKSLYLYSSESIPEKEFVIENEKLRKELEETNIKISELSVESDDNPVNSEHFISKASYFIMASKLTENRYVDYEKFIRPLDPIVPRNFITTIIKRIVVMGGKVYSIEFSNGIKLKFSYKKISPD